MTSLTWDSYRHRPARARPLLMAHRGASDDAPENTLASFALALEQGADILETDLRFTRDDEIVLMHDATVERTMDGTGDVSAMTLTEIKTLRARKPSPFPLSQFGRGVTDAVRCSSERHSARTRIAFWRGRGEGAASVPTLAELLEFTDVPLALELKDVRFSNPHDAQKLIEVLAQHNALERCAAVSFNLARLQCLKSLAPQLPIGIITLRNPFPVYPTEFVGPVFPLVYLNPLYMWMARRLNKFVCPLDPSPEPRIGYYLRLGVTVLLTNHPARTLKAISDFKF